MNQREALYETVLLINNRLNSWTLDWGRIAKLPSEMQQEHINEMCEVVKRGVNPQDTEKDFSEGKLGRWLGWIQASGVAMGVLTLDECKELNKKWAD